jgi:hypothetical protein
MTLAQPRWLSDHEHRVDPEHNHEYNDYYNDHYHGHDLCPTSAAISTNTTVDHHDDLTPAMTTMEPRP